MKDKSIKINVVLNVVKNFLTIVFPLITFPYVSRILQAENIGKVQFATSIVSYFALIASLGISTYAIREGAFLKKEPEKLKTFCNQVFSFNIITTLISYVLLGITVIFINKSSDYLMLIAIHSMTIIFTTLGIDWINSIYEDFLYITIRTIGIQILTLILTFLLIRNTDDYFWYAIIVVISSIGANILNFFYVRKYIKIKFTLKIDIKKHFKPIIILFSASLATTIYNSSDITMLGIMCGDYVVGIYYIGTKIYTIIKQLLNSAIAVIIPRIANYNSNNKESEKAELLNKIFKLLIFILLPTIIGIAILSKEIVVLISGEEYINSSGSLFILSFALLFAVIANFSSNLILITHKEEFKSLIATVAAAVINFALNFLLIPVLAEKGAALTTVIAEMVAATLSTIFARKYFKPQKYLKVLISSMLGCLLILTYSAFIKIFKLSLITHIALIIAGSVMIYFIFMYITNKSEYDSLIKRKQKVLK